MTRRTGTAELPLHGGRVPQWLATRMAALGRVIVEALVLEYGRDEVLRRLADPFWFQCFGAVMGMDWHSSGITTSVIGALRRGLAPVADDLGLYVCGGRGRHSRRTPFELEMVAERTGFDAAPLIRTSRLVAAVDSAALQDGHQLYLHGFFVTAEGRWAVVQQGMNGDTGLARRYHWLGEGVRSFVDEPHAALDGQPGGDILNLVDRRSAPARSAQIELAVEDPDRIVRELATVAGKAPLLTMPTHHDVRREDVRLDRLQATLVAAHEAAPRDFESLLLARGVGARTVATLAYVAEVLHGTPARFSDPARFSYALGGKDGHPFPVPLDVYDATLEVLRRAVSAARLGRDEEMAALRRLDRRARALEGRSQGVSLEAVTRAERQQAARWNGRTVAGPVSRAPASGRTRRPARRAKSISQPDLF